MANYVRKSGDLKYRKINLESEGIPQFKEFTALGESISYTDKQVMEILEENGATKLYYANGAMVATYTYGGVDRILIGSDIPLERVWMRRIDGTGIPYKVPAGLIGKGGSVEFRVPCGVQGMELFGDKYFEMVYKLQKK